MPIEAGRGSRLAAAPQPATPQQLHNRATHAARLNAAPLLSSHRALPAVRGGRPSGSPFVIHRSQSTQRSERHRGRSEPTVVLKLDRFTSDAMTSEAARLGVSLEELASFAVLYYLADLDSGRIARQLPPR
jgi:hypothetical protein